ncbi:MAG: sodium:calcium antiporter [Armatimonadota bacterium]
MLQPIIRNAAYLYYFIGLRGGVQVLLSLISSYPLWLNLVIFALISVVIWLAGVQLQKAADTISIRTGLQRAFVGVILLSAATSLPETGITISASQTGDAELTIHTLMGATMTQMALLVITDFVACRRGALTHLSPQFILLYQGVGLIILLAVAIAAMSAGPMLVIYSVDMWAALILIVYVAIIYGAYRMQSYPRWQPIGLPDEAQNNISGGRLCIDESSNSGLIDIHLKSWKLTSIVILFSVSAIIILAAGWTAAIMAEVLSMQTGLGASFIGVTILAFATSTPELASVISSSRAGAYSLAISNIFGTNMYNIFLLVLAEIFYVKGSIFKDVHHSAIFAAAVATMIACTYLWGLLEHENRTILRMGWDSFITLLLFLGGYYVLYLLR